MKIQIVIFLLIAALFSSCNGQSKNSGVLPPKEYQQKLAGQKDAQLLDVRTPAEYAGQHLPGAVNVNWNGPDFESSVSSLDRQKPVFVYCKVGGRSGEAAAKLKEMGFNLVYDLEGGIMKWNAAGLPADTVSASGMSMADYEKILNSNQKVLVSFSAKWCAPCKKMAPYMSRLEKESTVTKIVRLDADEQKTLVTELKVDGLPTLLLYNNGKLTWSHMGFIGEDELKKKL